MADQDTTDWIADHLRRYLADGNEGHDLDTTRFGGGPNTPTLILKTIGRKSGRELLTPLIYGTWGEEYVLIASKGGAPDHPAWYLNLAAADQVAVQVREDRWRAKVRVAEGDERTLVWDYMEKLYPPYGDYKRATDRQIPVVLLKPVERIDQL